MSDEIYNGSAVAQNAKINPNGIHNEDFQYFVSLRHVMEEYAYYNSRSVMWAPQYRRQHAHNKISNLLNWQNFYGRSIFERKIIQPGYYAKNAVAVSGAQAASLGKVYSYVSTQKVESVATNLYSRIGAMVESSPALDYCWSNSLSTAGQPNTTYIAVGIERRTEYSLQNDTFLSLQNNQRDINFYISQKSVEWGTHTLNWESSNGNPFDAIEHFLNYQTL